jgi:hypothetical protein
MHFKYGLNVVDINHLCLPINFCEGKNCLKDKNCHVNNNFETLKIIFFTQVYMHTKVFSTDF